MASSSELLDKKKKDAVLICDECGEVFKKGYTKDRRARHIKLEHDLPRYARNINVAPPKAPERKFFRTWEEYDLWLDSYIRVFETASKKVVPPKTQRKANPPRAQVITPEHPKEYEYAQQPWPQVQEYFEPWRVQEWPNPNNYYFAGGYPHQVIGYPYHVGPIHPDDPRNVYYFQYGNPWHPAHGF